MKNTLKKYLSLLLICSLLLSLAGCNTSSKPADTGTTASSEATSELSSEAASDDVSTEAAEKETSYPVTVTDQADRTVTIEKEPAKIVSGYYIPSSLLIALGLSDKVVGIEAKADKRPIYKLACASLSPDLVILPLKLKDAAKSLTELGIPVLLVNPESPDQLSDMISLIATATNTQDKADQLLDFINQEKEMLTTSLATADDTPNIYLAGNSSLLSTAGPAMYQSGIIELAGGKNVASDISDTYWAEISYEQLLSWDPDYIILASDAEYTVDDVLSDPNLKDCTAVKNNHIYAIPGDIEALDSPVPASILASIWLAGILHPDQVSTDTYTKEMNSFYETFYGIKK